MQFNHWHGCLARSAQRGGGQRGTASQPYDVGRGKKTLLSIGLVLTLLMVVLAGCGESGSQSGQTVHLTYALWDANQQATYQKSIEEFEKLHPNIKVTIEQNPWTQYWQKLDTQIAGHNAPDVFWDHAAYFPQLVQEGALMDLSSLIQQDKVDLSVYYPQLLKPYQYQGDYYGLPKDWDTITLFYNKNLLQQAGVSVDDLNNMTWNPTDGGSFLAALQKLTVDKSGHHAGQPGFDASAVKQYGFVSLNSNQEIYLNYIAMNGGSFLDKPFGTNFTFNQPKSVQALQFLVDLNNKWHVSPPASETNNASNIAEQLFGSGKAAIIETGSWNLNFINSQTNFPWGVAQLPAGPQGRISVFNGLADAIYAKTQHPKEAWELFKWLSSPQSEQLVGSLGTVWPGVQSADQGFVQYWQKKNIDVNPFLKEAQGTTVSFPITSGFNEANTKINDIFNQMYLGQIPVQQATNTAVQQGNAALQSAANGG